MLFDLIAIIAPVFLCAGIGYGWAKSKLPFDNETVTGLVTNVGTPLMVFDTLVRSNLGINSFGVMTVATVVAIFGIGVIGLIFTRVCRFQVADALPALMFSNAGNMGLSICLFAFGEVGLGLGITFFATMVVIQFTFGIAIAAGSTSIMFLLRSPVVYSVAAALFFMGFDLEMPRWLANTTHLLAGFAIPLMLIALGVSMANLRISMLGDSLIIALARLGIGFLVGTGVAILFDLAPVQAGVLIIECSMPVAVFNYLFALRYNRMPETIAGSVVISTLISFATLPVLLYLVLSGVPGTVG